MTSEVYTIPKDLNNAIDLSADVTQQSDDKVMGIQRSTFDNITKIFAELVGTGLLMFLGCMSCVTGLGNSPSPFEIGISFGFTVMIVLQIFGCVSGAHINPSVTVAAYIYNLISWPMAIAYIVAQFIGAFLGFGILKLVSPYEIFEKDDETTPGICSTVPHAKLTAVQAFSVEFIATMFLILVCCGVWDPRNSKNTDSVPLKFGFTIACLSIAAGPYTGASVNPARTLAPAIWNNDYYLHWVYWFAPISAAIVTSLVYKIVFRREAAPEPLSRVEELLLLSKDKLSF